ncbi:MAG: hypothetical protein ACRD4Q_10985 [Candidatus Acidiferrales bacterium]
MRRTHYARRERDFQYLKWIRSLPCFLCGKRFYIEAAHIGLRAFGCKCEDRETAPACRWCHQTGPHSLHRMGRKFWAHHGIDRMELIARLQGEYEEFRAAA